MSKGKNHWIDLSTQLWVKLTGKRIQHSKEWNWLFGPSGDSEIIGEGFIHKFAKENGYRVHIPKKASGIIPNMKDLFHNSAEVKRMDPKVRNFYEHTSNYDMDVWAKWTGIFQPFAWLLTTIFSRRLQQMNLPLDALDTCYGMNSKVILLTKNKDQTENLVFWLRHLKGTGNVLYCGIYSVQKNQSGSTFVRVIFPLPNGNATVVLKPEILPDGSLKLISKGKKFGESGFYFFVFNRKGDAWIRYLPSFHEFIHVFVDFEGTLRAEHKVFLFRWQVLHLHYKIFLKK
ncbi:hypothetical protein CH373_01025 [Leptospira perolatii]|uniref:Uncharacterized protein n=1 Tax=Leptospira perolatii TaxID=2023191 RepID=A0A2M9ZRL9_9LEPT|nr:hypothetical protein [Leptospira perolatii]PJZ71133.1 hypothetical protein CH360_01025 [Leptospira perolatii]PJZ74665.1 hypothetical protein CH373_01025 [Leptospira perolatii]